MTDTERALTAIENLSKQERRRLVGLIRQQEGGFRPVVKLLSDEEVDRLAPGAREAAKQIAGGVEGFYLDEKKRLRARLLRTNWTERDPGWYDWA